MENQDESKILRLQSQIAELHVESDKIRNRANSRRAGERHFADTRVVAVYRIDRRTANVWGEWSSYPADKGTASINYDATLQGKSPVRGTSYIRLRSFPFPLFLPLILSLPVARRLSYFHPWHPTLSPQSSFDVDDPPLRPPGPTRMAKGRRATEL